MVWADCRQGSGLPCCAPWVRVRSGRFCPTQMTLQVSPDPLVVPATPPASPGDSASLCRIPGLGYPINGWNCSLPRAGLCPGDLPFPLIPLPGPYIPTWWVFLPSSLPTRGSCLKPRVFRSLSASLQFLFSENGPTCRCILDVLAEGSEFWVLLPCHLNQLPRGFILTCFTFHAMTSGCWKGKLGYKYLLKYCYMY